MQIARIFMSIAAAKIFALQEDSRLCQAQQDYKSSIYLQYVKSLIVFQDNALKILIAYIFLKPIKSKMQQSIKLIKCPHQHSSNIVCLTYSCSAISPFICDGANCKCSTLHSRCMTMKIDAFSDYLVNWKKWIGKGCKDFMNRVGSIYANAKDKLDRQQKLFEEYCKDLFVGQNHSKVVYLVQKRDFSALTSDLLWSSIQKVIEPNQSIVFQSFTLSEMRKVDEKIKNLMDCIGQLYKSKQIKRVEPQKIVRCNSATLTRSNLTTQKQLIKSLKINDEPFKEIIKMKIDLAYPKSINSKIVQQATVLNKLIGKKIKKYHLAYRASESSFNISEFYYKMNVIQQKIASNYFKSNQKMDVMSIILIKSQFGKVIGGFTSLKWQKNAEKIEYIQSQQDQYNPQATHHRQKYKNGVKFKMDRFASTNIFSLDLMQRYDLLKPEQAIYCGKTSIGFGKNDIRITQKGNIHRKNYCKFPCSYNYQKQPYQTISKSGMNMSGCKYSPFFKVEQWQAFLIEL